jgi:RNA polymerase sigma factor (sigma-70 family)
LAELEIYTFLGYFSYLTVLNISLLNISENEQSLLKGLAKNDRQAIEAIYRENYAMIQSFVLKNSGSSDDARDVFQEAMIVLYEKATSTTFELRAQIRTYLYSVCRLIWLKKLQVANRHAHTSVMLEETLPVEDDVVDHEAKNNKVILMENSLKRMGEPCKSLLMAFYFEKKTMPEIADAFGYTNADNAKTQKYKCLMRLKKIFFSGYKNGD